MDTTALVLLLSDLPGFGEKTLERVLTRAAALGISPSNLLQLPHSQWSALFEISPQKAQQASQITPRKAAQADEAAGALRRAGIHIITRMDAAYPAKLIQRIPQPPPILTLYGNTRLLEAHLFCTANSNHAPETALAACDTHFQTLLQQGAAPVTGHNRIPYQRAALAARRHGAPVAYILDRGLLTAFSGDLTRDLFPAARIWSPNFDPRTDLALSPFLLTGPSIAHRNRTRDALIFALADTIVAGCIRPNGQMEHQLNQAAAHNIRILRAWENHNAPA
jgi:hypothetical protein